MKDYLETIQKLDETIESIQQDIEQKQGVVDNLNQTKVTLLKMSNLCSVCYGVGKLYKPSNDGDPYHRSSDDWVTCPYCNGTGKPQTKKEGN